MAVKILCVVLLLTGHSLATESKTTEPFCPSDTGIQNHILEKFVDLANSVVKLQENFDMKIAELRTKEENLELERNAFITSLSTLADAVSINITQKMADLDEKIEINLKSVVEETNKKVFEKITELDQKSKDTSIELDTFIQTSNTGLQAMMTEMQARGNEYFFELENARNKIEGETENLKQSLSEDINASVALVGNRLQDDMSDLVSATQLKFDNLYRNVFTLANTSLAEIQSYAKGHLKPNIAFLARGLSTSTPGRYRKLYFRSTEVNTENVYNKYSGEFTAPIEGTYWFSAQICGEYNSYVSFRIYVNGNAMSDSSNRNSDYGICTTSNTVAILKKGAKAYVATGGNTNRDDKSINLGSNRWNMFMGALIN